MDKNVRLLESGGLIDLRLMHGNMDQHPNISATFPQKFVDMLGELYASFGRIRVLIRYNRIMFLNEFEWERQMSQIELDETALLNKKKDIINNMRLIISSFTVVRLGEDGTELANGRYVGRYGNNNDQLLFELCADDSSISALATALESSTLEPVGPMALSGSIPASGSMVASGFIAPHGMASSTAASKRVLSDEVKVLVPSKKHRNEQMAAQVETEQSSSTTSMASTSLASRDEPKKDVLLKRSAVEQDEDQQEEQLSVKRVRTEELTHSTPPVKLVFDLPEVPVFKFIDLSLGSFNFESSSASSIPCALDQSSYSEDE